MVVASNLVQPQGRSGRNAGNACNVVAIKGLVLLCAVLRASSFAPSLPGRARTKGVSPQPMPPPMRRPSNHRRLPGFTALPGGVPQSQVVGSSMAATDNHNDTDAPSAAAVAVSASEAAAAEASAAAVAEASATAEASAAAVAAAPGSVAAGAIVAAVAIVPFAAAAAAVPLEATLVSLGALSRTLRQ